MGKKLFKFGGDGTPTVKPNPEEAAARTQERMRELIRRDYAPRQADLLRQLVNEEEGAAHYRETGVSTDTMVAPSIGDTLEMLSQQSGMRIVNIPADYPRIPIEARRLITADQAKARRLLPLEIREDGSAVFAIADPSDPTLTDWLRLMLGREVETVIADEQDIKDRIDQFYGGGDESLETLIDSADKETGAADEDVLRTDAQDINLSELEHNADISPVIRLVNALLLKAIQERASDIHVEPFPSFIRIRYRVDGVLREIPAPPRNMLLTLVSRLKVMANMNISETRLPQDGRVKLTAENREVDMRVSSVPTVHGESIVMRVLDKSMMNVGISHIGMLPEVLEHFKKLIAMPNGIVLVTGPTGGGKTTTLTASRAEVRDPGEKLITTEDPVEYELPGIQQVNINEKIGLTYARCLRAILRQDPDRVLVGEIRDVETAQIAVQASLTGHLVFSTLHTNSAAATVTRLLDMGVEPFLITSSLEAVVGQRLVRTICQSCKRPVKPSADDLFEFNVTLDDIREQGIQFYQGEGCNECNHTGYHGRMGIFELLVVDDDVRDLILERATTDEIQEVALRKGMISMRRDGWTKARMGLTTLAEILRQTPRESELGDSVSTSMLAEAGHVTDRPEPQLVEAGHGHGELPGPRPQLTDDSSPLDREAAARAKSKR